MNRHPDLELAHRESLLASAQCGPISVVDPQLSAPLETAGGEEAELCEAYSQGYIRVRDFSTDARPHARIGQIHAELSANEAAEAAFRTALRLDPKNASAALRLGQLLLDRKQPVDAIPPLRIATSDPALGLRDGRPGVCFEGRKPAEEAEAELDEALRRFPNDYRLLVEKANSTVEQGQYTEAESVLRGEIEASSSRREVRYTSALAVRGLGRVDEATPTPFRIRDGSC